MHYCYSLLLQWSWGREVRGHAEEWLCSSSGLCSFCTPTGILLVIPEGFPVTSILPVEVFYCYVIALANRYNNIFTYSNEYNNKSKRRNRKNQHWTVFPESVTWFFSLLCLGGGMQCTMQAFSRRLVLDVYYELLVQQLQLLYRPKYLRELCCEIWSSVLQKLINCDFRLFHAAICWFLFILDNLVRNRKFCQSGYRHF